MHFHFYTLPPLLLSTTNAAKSPQELIKDLNNRYRTGKPSNDASETGVAWRSFDSFADVTNHGLPSEHYEITEDVQTAKKMFGGTAAHPENLPASIINNDLSSSNEYGINLFRSWGLAVHPYQNDTIQRPAGIVYSPCAVDKALKCSYIQSADTDDRVNAGCGRLNIDGLNNLAEFRNLTSSCRAVFDLMKKFPDLPPFFESPGYYGTLSDASTRTQPKQQLKDMLQWQSILATASWNQNSGSTPWNPDDYDQLYNELALDVDAVDELEEEDECQAIEALVKVCGEHDPFYVDNADGSSRCIDYEHLFKLAFPKIDVPPIIWIDLNNTEEPCMSCDKMVPGGGDKQSIRPNFLRGIGKTTTIV